MTLNNTDLFTKLGISNENVSSSDAVNVGVLHSSAHTVLLSSAIVTARFFQSGTFGLFPCRSRLLHYSSSLLEFPLAYSDSSFDWMATCRWSLWMCVFISFYGKSQASRNSFEGLVLS